MCVHASLHYFSFVTACPTNCKDCKYVDGKSDCLVCDIGFDLSEDKQVCKGKRTKENQRADVR